MKSPLDVPFYSPVDQAISKLSQAKGTGDQYLSMIRNTHGVKPQEIEDRGLKQKMTGKMGLPDVQRIASENPMPKITESTAHQSDFYYAGKGADGKYYLHTDSGKPVSGPYETNDKAEKEIEKLSENKPQYAKYQLPGGSNYREIKLKLPVQGKPIGQIPPDRASRQGEKIYSEPTFQSSHFKDEPNILAHARVSDRKGPNGEKILHVEEIQSDWHQQARDLRHEEIDRLVENGMPEEEAKKTVPTNWGYGTPEDRKHIVDKLARDEKLTPEEESRRRQLLSNRVVPNAPFKKDWHELALKHLLDHAVKNGYDKMIITQGAEQAKRYDLSKHIGEINYKHNPDKTVSLMATDKENGSTVLHEEDVPHHKIHRYVGKGIAKKIMAGEGTPYQVSIPYEGGSMPIPTPARHAGKMTLSNLDLKTGDEGMKGFYDKIVPDFLNKYGKKWGAKVKPDTLITEPDYNIVKANAAKHYGEGSDAYNQAIQNMSKPVHSFDITPPMREEIVNKGQSRYAKGGDVKTPSLDAMRYALMQKNKLSNGGSDVKEPEEEYRGSHEAPGPENGAPMHDIKNIYPEDFYSHNGFRYYSDLGNDYDREAHNKVVSVKNKPDQMVWVHRAVPMAVYKAASKFETPLNHLIRRGDWVTQSKQYAKDHGEAWLNNDYKVVGKRVPAKHLYTEGNSIHEWGYYPDQNKASGGSVKEPKSTVPAYKLFRVDKKQPGKLFPLFVDANTPVEKDKWVPAKAGEMAGEKVKSKIGPLAYRPGWHAGDLPIATHIGEKSDSKLNKPDRRPHNQVWAEIEMANDVDWQKKANERGMNKNGKLIAKNAHITDQVPKGGHYRYKTNPNMTGSWLIGGEMKVKRVLPDEEVQKINKKAKVKDLPREKPLNLKEWGFKRGGLMSLLQSKD